MKWRYEVVKVLVRIFESAGLMSKLWKKPVANRDPELVEFNVEAIDGHGRTPLHLASENGHRSILDFLSLIASHCGMRQVDVVSS